MSGESDSDFKEFIFLNSQKNDKQKANPQETPQCEFIV